MLGRVFKAYDIRGTYPDYLTDHMGWQIGCGVAKYLLEDAAAAGETTPMMKNILVGRDMRTSSPKLSEELEWAAAGLRRPEIASHLGAVRALADRASVVHTYLWFVGD